MYVYIYVYMYTLTYHNNHYTSKFYVVCYVNNEICLLKCLNDILTIISPYIMDHAVVYDSYKFFPKMYN